ncbi:hypothetical protein [Parasphingorhabdus sp.]|uniref:hypothetical protein n=1 Tax=Parasphingorhabdus sp. TaxID=2709688 RepID=UPI003C751887
MTVFQTIAYYCFRSILAGAALALFPGAVVLAQSPSDDLVPNPRIRPPLENYSLPPGPDSRPEEKVLQGPVDAEIPIARPPVVAPRTGPAIAAPEPGNATVAPAANDNGDRQAQQTVRQNPVRLPATEAISPPEPDLPKEKPGVVVDQRRDSTGVPANKNEVRPSLPEAPADPVSATPANDWYLLLVAGLFFILLGAMYLWRAHRASLKQSSAPKAGASKTRQTGPIVKLPEPLQPAPGVAISFQPRSANATLFNAVVGFELRLSNPGNEVLTGIRVTGAMVQAGEDGTDNPISADLSPLGAVSNLPVGETKKFVTEFRIPLASIHPIMFRSQALFVPLVQISIEFTDGAGFQHYQTAAYLVGQEHQPPRPKMAPFRLDLGPRGFAPLGHRPLTAG